MTIGHIFQTRTSTASGNVTDRTLREAGLQRDGLIDLAGPALDAVAGGCGRRRRGGAPTPAPQPLKVVD